MRSGVSSPSLAVFFLGIFLGFLFLLATVLIIYYKQITEGYEDQTRFRTLQQVGMSRRRSAGPSTPRSSPSSSCPFWGRAPHGLRLPHDLQNASPLQPHRPDPCKSLPPPSPSSFGVIHTGRSPPHLPLLLPHRHPCPPRALPLSCHAVGERMEGNQALRHLHPNLLHTSPAPRSPWGGG